MATRSNEKMVAEGLAVVTTVVKIRAGPLETTPSKKTAGVRGRISVQDSRAAWTSRLSGGVAIVAGMLPFDRPNAHSDTACQRLRTIPVYSIDFVHGPIPGLTIAARSYITLSKK
jgi:hypothetical protein